MTSENIALFHKYPQKDKEDNKDVVISKANGQYSLFFFGMENPPWE